MLFDVARGLLPSVAVRFPSTLPSRTWMGGLEEHEQSRLCGSDMVCRSVRITAVVDWLADGRGRTAMCLSMRTGECGLANRFHQLLGR